MVEDNTEKQSDAELAKATSVIDAARMEAGLLTIFSGVAVDFGKLLGAEQPWEMIYREVKTNPDLLVRRDFEEVLRDVGRICFHLGVITGVEGVVLGKEERIQGLLERNKLVRDRLTQMQERQK